MAGRRYSEADLVAMIPLYLDGALDDDERRAVEAYWREHPEALAQFADSTRLIDLLDEAVTPVAPPDDFTDHVMAAVSELGPIRRWWQRQTLIPPLTAARLGVEALLLLLIVTLLWRHPWAPPIARLECRLMGDETWVLGQRAGVRVLLTDHRHHTPVANAEVRLRIYQNRRHVRLLEARTNDQGSLDADLLPGPELVEGRAVLVAEAVAPTGRATVWHDLNLVRRDPVSLSLISPAVRAGGTLRAAVAVAGGEGFDPAEELAWRLDDRDGRAVAAGQAALSADGLALLAIPVGSRVATGPAMLWVRAAGGRAAAAVRLDPPRAGALPVTLSVDADGAVTGRWLTGQVEVETGGAPEVELTVKVYAGDAAVAVSGRPDAAGRWRFGLRVPVPSRPTRSVRVAARASDSWGRAGSDDLVLPAMSAGGQLQVDHVATLVAGLDNWVIVSARAPDGSSPDRIQIRVNGSRERSFALTRGVANLTIRPRAGWNRIDLRARPGGWTARRTVWLQATPGEQGLRLQPDRVTAEPGQPVRVHVAAPGPCGPVCLDILDGGRLIESRSLDLERGAGEIVVPAPDARRRLVLRAYAPGPHGWRTAVAAVAVARTASAPLFPFPSGPSDGVRVGYHGPGTPPAEVLLAAVSPPVRAAGPKPGLNPPRMRGMTLAESSIRLAQRQALRDQRRFFSASPLVGGLLGGLVLAGVMLWLLSFLTDPFEVVGRAEAVGWGGVPQVHRRHAWAGLGALIGGLVVAVTLAGGILLAGWQARELANSADAPLPDWPPPRPSWQTVVAESVASGLRLADPELPVGRAADRAVTVFAPLQAGVAEAPALLPSDGERWLVQALAATAGRLTERRFARRTPGSIRLELAAPARLTIGDVVVLPLAVVNRSPQRRPLAVTAEPGAGLELTAAPTRRVVAEPGERLELGLGVRGAEYGRPKLTVTAEGPEGELRTAAELTILPGAPRHRRTELGTVGGRTELAYDLPAGASGRDLRLTCAAQPADLWDQVLAQAARQPVATLWDLIGIGSAQVERCRLWSSAGELTGRRRERLTCDLIRTYQWLLLYEVRHETRLTGAFALRPGGRPDKLATAETLKLLRDIGPFAEVDPALRRRSARWLLASYHPHNGTWLADGADEQPSRVLLTTALIGSAVAGLEGAEEAVEGALRTAAEHGLEATDLPTLAIAARFLADRPERREEALAKLLDRLATLRDQRADGSNWYAPDSASPIGASGRAAACEATALAVLALAGSAQRAARQAAADGARYLLTHVGDDGTWGAAWVTALAVRAVTAVEPMGGQARGVLVAEMDGRTIGRVTFDGTRQDYRYADFPAARPGRLTLRFFGRGQPGYRLELAYSHSLPVPLPRGVHLAVALSDLSVRPHDRLVATLRLRNTAQPLAAAVARIDLPPGFQPEPMPGAVLDGGVWEVPLGALGEGETRTVALPLRARAAAARVAPRTVTVTDLYNPDRGGATRLPALRIS